MRSWIEKKMTFRLFKRHYWTTTVAFDCVHKGIFSFYWNVFPYLGMNMNYGSQIVEGKGLFEVIWSLFWDDLVELILHQRRIVLTVDWLEIRREKFDYIFHVKCIDCRSEGDISVRISIFGVKIFVASEVSLWDIEHLLFFLVFPIYLKRYREYMFFFLIKADCFILSVFQMILTCLNNICLLLWSIEFLSTLSFHILKM